MMLYHYRARLLRVIDGDTVHATIDYGFDQRGDYTLRLEGLDAPERGTEEGSAATAHLSELLEKGPLTVETIKDRREKYGRYRAILWVTLPDSSLLCVNDQMISDGHAVRRVY